MVIFGAFNVLATGFVDNLVIDGKPFAADAGPKHILAGFTALVAGRYRQERETEEGKVGMEEVAKMESRFGKDGLRPTPREVSMCLDHREELEKKRPRNPTSHEAFADGRWKTFTKIRCGIFLGVYQIWSASNSYMTPIFMLALYHFWSSSVQ